MHHTHYTEDGAIRRLLFALHIRALQEIENLLASKNESGWKPGM